MVSSSDPRFAFLRDPDLYDLTGRMALKIFREPAAAEDCRHNAYIVAMQLVGAGRGPREGHERGWMCCVLKNHAYAELRRLKRGERPVDTTEYPDIPVDDQQTLFEQQQQAERLSEVARQTLAEHPEHAERVLATDGQSGKGAPKDAASRKRKERSRLFLASTISAAVAAAVAVFFMMLRPPPPIVWNSATLATASRQLASKRCAEQKWTECLLDYNQADAFDAAKPPPAEMAARRDAVAGLRRDAYAACGSQQWMECVRGLDSARRYDPEGDATEQAKVARAEAESHLGKRSRPPLDPDVKKDPPLH